MDVLYKTNQKCGEEVQTLDDMKETVGYIDLSKQGVK